MLPYFLKSENNADMKPSMFHAKGGPLSVSSLAGKLLHSGIGSLFVV